MRNVEIELEAALEKLRGAAKDLQKGAREAQKLAAEAQKELTKYLPGAACVCGSGRACACLLWELLRPSPDAVAPTSV